MKRFVCAVLLALMLAVTLTGCGAFVPKPEIKRGEFDFSVTYTYGGESKTVSGVYVCEYNGKEWTLDGGYTRAWTGYIKGGKIEDHVIIDTVDGDEIILVLNLSPEYFMDDFDTELYDLPAPYMMIKDCMEDGCVGFIYDADEIEALCGARVISYQYEKPVENTFGIFK